MSLRLAHALSALLTGWSAVVSFGSPGPFSPCGAPQPGAGSARVEGYSGGSPFDTQSMLAGALALALLLAIVGFVVLRRRRGVTSWRYPLWLAGGSLVVAGLMAAWLWQIRTSYLGGCAVTFNASPFSQTQASGLASAFVVIIGALALVWAVMAARSARRAA